MSQSLQPLVALPRLIGHLGLFLPATQQQIDSLKSLIDLARRRRNWLDPQDKPACLVSDTAVSRSFESLVQLSQSSQAQPRHPQETVASLGLSAQNLRCVFKSLRRSQHILFWDTPLMENVWQSMIQARSNDNRLDTHARFGIRAIIKWISSPSPPSQLQPSLQQGDHQVHQFSTLDLCRKVYSQLIDWNYISPEQDIYHIHHPLQPSHHVIVTILGSIINASIRKYNADPRNRDHHKLFKDALEALQTVWDILSVQPLEQGSSLILEGLAKRVVHSFLDAVKHDHRSPAPQVVAVLIRYAQLPTVQHRRRTAGDDDPHCQILSSDDLLYKATLDTLFDLGRASLLVQTWTTLIPQLNLAKLHWPLLRLLSALEELANPLVRGERGKPLNPFKLVRLVLQLIDSLANETDTRMTPCRLRAWRIIMENPATQQFDWLGVPERRFDRYGIELFDQTDVQVQTDGRRHRDVLQAHNLAALVRLWKSSWPSVGLCIDEQQPHLMTTSLPLSTLRSITRLATAIPSDQTIDMLKQAITIFVTHRTPVLPLHSTSSNHLPFVKPRLGHQERTALIAAHLVIGTELSQKFTTEIYESFISDQLVPCVEDMKYLWKLMRQILGNQEADQIWIEKAKETKGLPWTTQNWERIDRHKRSGSDDEDNEKTRIARLVLGNNSDEQEDQNT